MLYCVQGSHSHSLYLIYALLSRNQPCRVYALFGGHFWPKIWWEGAQKHFKGPGSMGGWHPAAEGEVKKLGSALARHTSQMEGKAISHLWGRLGILLQRGNVALLGNRVQTIPGPAIDGILE